jgi:arylsulfatase A-like enzyme
MSKIKNILIFVVDDLRPELNCFGKKKLHTPNIDRLAERSVRFEKAYCQFPQCMPSRASFMTGIRPKVFCNWSNQLLKEGELSLPALMKKNGFKTVSAGKVYHEPLDDEQSWDELHKETFKETKPGSGIFEQSFHDYQLEENKQKTREKFKLDWRELRKNHSILPPLSECADALEENYVDAVVAARALDVIDRQKNIDTPLFLGVGFYRPHLPWVAPKKYWDLYKREEVDLADNPFFPENAIGKTNLCDFMHYEDEEVHKLYSDIGRYTDDDFPVLSREKQQECVHAYWASVSFMDAQLGRVMDGLEKANMSENTAIFFLGDNGWHLGEHKLWSKVSNFDESTRVPLMVSVPGMTKGTATQNLAELVDIYPTICDLLGIEKPAHLEGQSLRENGLEDSSQTKKAVFASNWNSINILTERFRLTCYHDTSKIRDEQVIAGRGNIELFDHLKDPKENKNAAKYPEYAETVKELSAMLKNNYGS